MFKTIQKSIFIFHKRIRMFESLFGYNAFLFDCNTPQFGKVWNKKSPEKSNETIRLAQIWGHWLKMEYFAYLFTPRIATGHHLFNINIHEIFSTAYLLSDFVSGSNAFDLHLKQN